MIDHAVRVHYKAIKGDKRAEDGTPDSVLFSTRLEIDGEHVFRSTHERGVQWSIVGTFGGFMYLELFRPSEEVRARFTPEDVALVEDVEDDGDLLRLHVRSIEFVHEPLPQPVPVLPVPE